MIGNEHRDDARRKSGGMTRRSALRTVATGAGVTATALWLDRLNLLAQDPAMHTHVLVSSAQAAAAPFTAKVFNPAQLETVATLAELIIPTTETPGARAVFVDRFIDNLMANAQATDKERFLAGLAWIDTRSNALYGKPFTGATPAQQTELLTKLSAESGQAVEDAPGAPFFRAMKQMTIAGYYTTQIGLEKELGDDGQLFNAKFVGCTHNEHQI